MRRQQQTINNNLLFSVRLRFPRNGVFGPEEKGGASLFFFPYPEKKKRVLLTNHARTKQEAGKEEGDEATYKNRKQINQHGWGI